MKKTHPLRVLWNTVAALVRRPRVEDELDEELQAHLAFEAEQNRARGMSSADAMRAARVGFGSTESIKEQVREARGFAPLDRLTQDLRYTGRMIARAPGFALVVVLTLALGIGANTAIFSAVYAVLLRPLPFDAPARLFFVWEDSSRYGFPKDTPAPANFVDWREQSESFDDMAALLQGEFKLTGLDEPLLLAGHYVTDNFFDLLGVDPAAGRLLRPGDGRAEFDGVVISHRLWQSAFSGNHGVIGRSIRVDGKTNTITGVLPADYRLLSADVDLWAPLPIDEAFRQNRGNHSLVVIGRLAPGTTEDAARTEMDLIGSRLAESYPDTNAGIGIVVEPFRMAFSGETRSTLILLLAAVGLVLLIACSNVANLLLARASVRRREMETRAALGAGRLRLIRQLLTESLVLSALGAALGIAGAAAVLDVLSGLLPDALSAGDMRLGLPVVLFAVVLSTLTAVVFGLVPAWQAATAASSIGTGSRGATSGRGVRRTHAALVIAETALALTLLVAAAVVTRSFQELQSLPLGFDPSGTITMTTALIGEEYREPDQSAFFDEVVEQIEGLPGVEHAGYITRLPMTYSGLNVLFIAEGAGIPEPGNEPVVSLRVVTPGYLDAVGMTLFRGRGIAASDDADAPPVAVINRAMARRLWSGEEDVVGRRITKLNGREIGQAFTVVGVAEDVRQWQVAEKPRPEIYLAYPQFLHRFTRPQDLVVRAAGDPAALAPAIRRIIRAIDPDQPITNVGSLATIVATDLARHRLQFLLFSGFGITALLLAAIGIYGVIAYGVASRTREIGVRMALGAQRTHILRNVVVHGLTLSAIGILAGVLPALLLTRFLAATLPEASSFDSIGFAAMAFSLIGVASLATLVPARRAIAIEPNRALRDE